MENKKRDLVALAIPLVEYLQEEHNPHCKIIISSDGVKIVEETLSIPIKLKAQP